MVGVCQALSKSDFKYIQSYIECPGPTADAVDKVKVKVFGHLFVTYFINDGEESTIPSWKRHIWFWAWATDWRRFSKWFKLKKEASLLP